MRENLAFVLVAASIALASSCAGPKPASTTESASPDDPVAAERMQLPARVKLDDALTFAWYRHPAMESAQHLIGAAHGARVQAGLWPRPEMELSYADKKGMESDKGIGLAQKIELGGKRGARMAVADAEIFLREAGLVERWTGVRARIKEAFVRLAFAREGRALRQGIAEIDAERERLVASLANAGKATEGHLLEARKKSAESAGAAKAAESRLADAERQVFAAMGIGDGATAVEIVCDLDMKDLAATAFEDLKASAMTNNPVLNTARGRAVLADARHRMAMASRWPDLKISGAYVTIASEDEAKGTTDGFAAGVSLDLPLWNRGQGDVTAARESREASAADRNAAELDVVSELSKFVAEAESRRAEEKAYRQDIVFAAERKNKLDENLFRNGKLSRDKFLDSLRELQETRLRHAEAKWMTLVSIIQIERIVAVRDAGR
jgi:cobalt-zinc-cadmium efflux system outer membrane protein